MKACTYSLSDRAHAIIVLHACKYPASAINGVVLGRTAAGGVELVDAIPLFHSFLALPARLEVALKQIDEYARERQLSIVGYYHAAESAGSSSSRPDALAKAVAKRIAQGFPQACILVVNNHAVHPPFAQCVEAWGPSGTDWASAGVLSGGDAAAGLVRAKAYRGLADFDDHLADIAADWTNAVLAV